MAQLLRLDLFAHILGHRFYISSSQIYACIVSLFYFGFDDGLYSSANAEPAAASCESRQRENRSAHNARTGNANR